MVELALAAMVVLYLIMGIVDLGRAFVAYNAVANTAREGARYATVASRTSGEIVAYALAHAGLSGVAVSVVSRGTAGDPANPAVVEASYQFSPITPLISQVCCSGGPLTLSARSTMVVEP